MCGDTRPAHTSVCFWYAWRNLGATRCRSGRMILELGPHSRLGVYDITSQIGTGTVMVVPSARFCMTM